MRYLYHPFSLLASVELRHIRLFGHIVALLSVRPSVLSIVVFSVMVTLPFSFSLHDQQMVLQAVILLLQALVICIAFEEELTPFIVLSPIDTVTWRSLWLWGGGSALFLVFCSPLHLLVLSFNHRSVR